MAGSPHTPDNRPEAHATKAPTLDKRIEDMEERLALERIQAVAHARAYGGTVRGRLTSPTSIIFSASMGFIASELIGARSRVVKEAQKQGKSKKQQKAAGKSVFASLVKPIIPLARVGMLGLFAKKNKDIAEQVDAVTPDDGGSNTLH